MLSVYFTAPTSFDGVLQSYYKRILEAIKKFGSEVLSGDQVVSKKLLKDDKKLTKEEIFNREKKLIDQADCIVAEVSRPSLGVGSEINYALSLRKPVLALVLEGYEDTISPIIAGNPSDNLYIVHYSIDELHLRLKHFFNHIETRKKRKGKLVVIDGGDGSGKTSQAKLLIEHLRKNRVAHKYFDFPQYYLSFHGNTVAKFLRGEFGSINETSPYLSSLAYALDRASAKELMQERLQDGDIVIANRYATSNMAHQGAKFKNEKEQKEYMKWVFELEYKVHRIPREDIVIYLHVPWNFAIKLSAKREKQKYLKTAIKDIHEADLVYQKAVEQMYLDLAKQYNHWVVIECVEKGVLLSEEKIHKKVLEVLDSKRIL